MKIPERAIQGQIIQYLHYRGVKAYRINAGMIPTGEKRSRRMIRLAPKGSADIWGVLPADRDGNNAGRAIFVEVKAKGNKPTASQIHFLQDMKEQGAVVVVAYSVDDVEQALACLI